MHRASRWSSAGTSLHHLHGPPARASNVQCLFELAGAVVVSVLREDAAERGIADLLRASRRQRPHVLGHFAAVLRDENLLARLEELFDALERIGDEARARAGGFEDAGRGRC